MKNSRKALLIFEAIITLISISLAIFYLVVAKYDFTLFYSLLTISNLLILSTEWSCSEYVKEKFVFTCPKCGEKIRPSFFRWLFVPHIFSKRYMRCNNCKKLNWMKRK